MRVMVYGADWCGDTMQTLTHLDSLGVPYVYVDVDQDPKAKAWVIKVNGGKQKTPTLEVEGEILSVPEDEELDEVLRAKHMMA